MKTLTLVCEGACNPRIAEIEFALTQFRTSPRGRADDGLVPMPPPALASSLRSLVHTPHEVRNNEIAECATCHTARRHNRTRAWSYGGKKMHDGPVATPLSN